MAHSSLEDGHLYAEIKVLYEDLNQLWDEDYERIEFINWQPPYDLYVIDEKVYITIELPGVDIKDITIYVAPTHMVISGVKSPSLREKHQEKVVFHNLEIAYGRFARHIDFPIPVEYKKGDYKLEQGVLTIKFPIIKEYIIPIEEQ